MPVPTYPKFKFLEITDKKTIENLTKGFQPYSDFNFTSLWAWNTKNDAEISKLNNNLVIKFADYISGRPFYTLIGRQRLDETATKLCLDAKKQRISHRLQLVPEVVAKSITHKDNFIIRSDRNNHDYLIDLKDFVKLSGAPYRSLRHDVNKFKENFGDGISFKPINLSNRRIRNALLGLFKDWQKQTPQEFAETESELIALSRLIDGADAFNLLSFGLFYKQRLIGFSIYEKLSDNNGIGHFEKTDVNFRGATAFLKLRSAQKLLEKNVKLFNEEQDLGLPGLRKSKLLHRPAKFLRKYFISLRK